MLYTVKDGASVALHETPQFAAHYDVCVVGLGTAGAIAAIAAAQEGASVLGIERTSHIGGMGAAGCVWDYFYGTMGGIAVQINERGYRKMLQEKKYVDGGGRSIRDEVIPGLLKNDLLTEAFEQAASAESTLLLMHTLIGVWMDGETIVGIRAVGSQGIRDFGCTVLIDCTEGDACRMVGCRLMPGRADGHTLNFSHMAGMESNGMIRAGWRFEGFPESTDALDWSAKILGSAPYHESYDTRYLFEGAILGLREAPSVCTDVAYTLADAAHGVVPEKPVYYGFSLIDTTVSDFENEMEWTQNWHVLCALKHCGISVGIPLGTMIAAGKKGLMIASRAKGTGHELASGMRMKFDLEKGGEAAGRAAAMAAKAHCDVREIDYEVLKAKLTATGCYNEAHNWGFCDLNEPYRDEKNGMRWRPMPIPKDLDGIRVAFRSHEPGPTLWTIAGHCSDELHAQLVAWLDSDERMIAENSAIALGMLEDRAAIPGLMAILRRRPEAYYYRVPVIKNIFGWPMASPYCNFTKAVILLGRFKAAEARPLLEDIAANGEAYAEKMMREEGTPSKEVYAGQFIAHAQKAIAKL